jgi:hypothetical protein
MTQAHEEYLQIAEELSDPKTTLEDIDSKVVARAKAWAKASHHHWPPRPASSGMQVFFLRTKEKS